MLFGLCKEWSSWFSLHKAGILLRPLVTGHSPWQQHCLGCTGWVSTGEPGVWGLSTWGLLPSQVRLAPAATILVRAHKRGRKLNGRKLSGALFSLPLFLTSTVVLRASVGCRCWTASQCYVSGGHVPRLNPHCGSLSFWAKMWDIAEIFKSSQSEEEVEGEEALMYLARRYKGLTVNACAHAIFFCKLLHALRPSKAEKGLPTSLVDNCGLKIGIIGGGHLGKQLAQALLTLSWAPCCSIRISTRRPESLDLQEQGVKCFYDNAQLAAWADVVFLCCLPSQVLTVCSVVRPAIRKPSVVYSLVTALPLRRLKQLLSYSAIVRPQYQCSGREPINEWGMKGTVTAALQDPAVVQATCPCSSQGKIRVNAKWLVAIFYAALNSSMWQSLPHQKALKLLNDLCFPEHCAICAEQKASCPQFVCESFVSKTFASSMTLEETFPWFDLTAAQLRESPFSQLLENSESVRSHLALLYQESFGDWPTCRATWADQRQCISYFSCSGARCDVGSQVLILHNCF